MHDSQENEHHGQTGAKRVPERARVSAARTRDPDPGTLYIVGLGNPGAKYADTRHNVGFRALAHVIEALGLPQPVESRKYSGQISEGVWSNRPVVLLMPHTYMNNSGSAVRKLVPMGEEKRLIVLYDDVDLPVGEMKVSFGRGSGGHNGVQSIIDALKTKDFARIRIGVASRGLFGGVKRPAGEKLSRHVLGAFTSREEKQLAEVLTRAGSAVEAILTNGVEQAMNAHN